MEEKKTIFIVVAYGGHYDDAWSNNVFATFDKEKAEAKILEEKDVNGKRARLSEEIYLAKETFYQEHPMPKGETPPAIKKWKAGIHMDEITPAMREERDAIIAERNRISEINAGITAAWYKEEREYINTKFAALGISEEEISKAEGFNTEQINYTIEEVPFG